MKLPQKELETVTFPKHPNTKSEIVENIVSTIELNKITNKSYHNHNDLLKAVRKYINKLY